MVTYMHHGYHGTKTENAKGECKGNHIPAYSWMKTLPIWPTKTSLSHEISSSTGNSRLVSNGIFRSFVTPTWEKERKKREGEMKKECGNLTKGSPHQWAPFFFFLKTSESWFVPTFRPRFDHEIMVHNLIGGLYVSKSSFFYYFL